MFFIFIFPEVPENCLNAISNVLAFLAAPSSYLHTAPCCLSSPHSSTEYFSMHADSFEYNCFSSVKMLRTQTCLELLQKRDTCIIMRQGVFEFE